MPREPADGSAVTLAGASTTRALAARMRWVPLTEPVTVPIVLVLPAVEHSPVADTFERVAVEHAAARWLGAGPS